MSTTLRVSALGRLIVEQARKDKGWKAQSQKWCSEANVAIATLRRFRRGDPITRESFIALCKAVGIDSWQEIVDASPLPSRHPCHFFAYDADIWVGRESLVHELTQKLKSDCRLLIIAGITGIGKTALAERLIVELQSTGHFKDSSVQENLDEQEKSTDFASFAIRLLEKSNQSVEPQAQKNPQMLLLQLVQHLRETPKFIVIDSLERLLKGNESEGWSAFEDGWFIKFFQALLSTSTLKSRLVLTSQEMPGQIQCIGNRYQNFWHCEALYGLSEKAQLRLFSKICPASKYAARDIEYLNNVSSMTSSGMKKG